jgi:hypothetical protein
MERFGVVGNPDCIVYYPRRKRQTPQSVGACRTLGRNPRAFTRPDSAPPRDRVGRKVLRSYADTRHVSAPRAGGLRSAPNPTGVG